MNIFVKLGETGIEQVTTHPVKTEMTGWIRLGNAQVDSNTGDVTIGSDVIPYDDFVKYMRQFSVSTTGVVSYREGVTKQNLASTGKLSELDMSIPMTFTRANTVVNFGRL
ncbi:MAG: hypothetical protein IKA36_06915 [Clostridia bacterium]|nr:hypothetical protein [Clostridia bacterium]